jgi:hypothetical protein
LLDDYVNRVAAYERKIQELNQTIDTKEDTLAAQESVLKKHNLALPPMGRRARDEHKTQPLKRRDEADE